MDVTREEIRSDVVVEDEDIIKYVCDRTDEISRDLCERMLEAEYKYFVENGYIKAIVALPEKMFGGTFVKTNLIIEDFLYLTIFIQEFSM